MPEKLSRREFLKLTELGSASLFILKIETQPTESKEQETNPLIHCTNLLCLEYHDPEFKAGKDSGMTTEVFKAQLGFLKKADYYTPTAKEVSSFLKGELLLPYYSVILRFDLGTDKINPKTGKSIWYETFEELDKNKLHGIIFLIPQAVESCKEGISWREIAKYIKKGTISICSHGLPDHPNYKSISTEYAIQSMKQSKAILVEKLKQAGIANPEILGFAFPFDAVPENAKELIEEAGYEFFAGGTIKNGMNSAKSGQGNKEGIPAIYPYVYTDELKEVVINNSNTNLALLTIKGGLSLPDALIVNGNNIKISQEWEKYAIKLAKEVKYISPEVSSGRLVKPLSIIIHTDSQNPKNPEEWTAENTFFGANGEKRKVSVNFAVDTKRSIQLTPIFKREGSLWIPLPNQENQAARGMGASINIEMAGANYDEIIKNGKENEKKIVLETIENTARLVINILRLNEKEMPVFGHFEITIRGKSDPGNLTMKMLREKIEELKQISNPR